MKVKAKQGQTIYDVALQYYGAAVEGVVVLMEDNKGFSFDTELEPGQVIEIRSEVPELNANNVAMAKYYKENGMSFNSAYQRDASDSYVEAGYVEPGYVS